MDFCIFGRRWKKLVVVFLLASISSRVSATTFTIANGCSYTVWPGILSNAGTAALANGGFVLVSGQSTSISPPAGWSGRLWGRTDCNFSSDGEGTCATGDCGGKLQCDGAGGIPPATLAEFTLQGSGTIEDYYDVSLVDGFNLPITVTPSKTSSNGTCGVAGCSSNINNICPSELQVVDDGEVVSCKSACLALQLAQYCCDGAYANPTTCKPTTYSELFKSACPNAYSYAYDDPTSIFTCSEADYAITFCPLGSSQKSTNGTTSSGPTMSSQEWNEDASCAELTTRQGPYMSCWSVGVILLGWAVTARRYDL